MKRVIFRIDIDGKPYDTRSYPAKDAQEVGNVAARCLDFYARLMDTDGVTLRECPNFQAAFVATWKKDAMGYVRTPAY
jgi:hypothetical protein